MRLSRIVAWVALGTSALGAARAGAQLAPPGRFAPAAHADAERAVWRVTAGAPGGAVADTAWWSAAARPARLGLDAAADRRVLRRNVWIGVAAGALAGAAYATYVFVEQCEDCMTVVPIYVGYTAIGTAVGALVGLVVSPPPGPVGDPPERR